MTIPAGPCQTLWCFFPQGPPRNRVNRPSAATRAGHDGGGQQGGVRAGARSVVSAGPVGHPRRGPPAMRIMSAPSSGCRTGRGRSGRRSPRCSSQSAHRPAGWPGATRVASTRAGIPRPEGQLCRCRGGGAQAGHRESPAWGPTARAASTWRADLGRVALVVAGLAGPQGELGRAPETPSIQARSAGLAPPRPQGPEEPPGPGWAQGSLRVITGPGSGTDRRGTGLRIRPKEV